MEFSVYTGNCLDMLKGMADSSADSIVTDPPYGLSDHKPDEVLACLTAWISGRAYEPKGKGFMGKKWDAWVPGPEVWREALRVLKPGGHVLAFAGTRSMDLMSMAIRLAGFELRDAIGYANDGGGAPLLAWTYGSGFPKSLNVAKAIESGAGRPEDIRRMQMGDAYEPSGRDRINYDHGAGSAMDGASADWQPSSDAARAWEGWGTALKPAWEPIILARKPLDSTVVENVLAHGTGALNIDACRVGWPDGKPPEIGTPAWGGPAKKLTAIPGQEGETVERMEPSPLGRWPANLIHDGSEEVLAAFPYAPGQIAAESHTAPSEKTSNVYGRMRREGEASAESDNEGVVGFKIKSGMRRLDTGSAARFFYCAKTSKKDRGAGNTHPTVKPTELMRYLVRLVTPPGGTVVDPYTGSGSTGKACMLEGFNFIGSEMDPDHADLARRRIAAACAESSETAANQQHDLFAA